MASEAILTCAKCGRLIEPEVAAMIGEVLKPEAKARQQLIDLINGDRRGGVTPFDIYPCPTCGDSPMRVQFTDAMKIGDA